MDIFGNNGNNPFDQNLNTTDTVDFTRVDVSGAIVDNSQLATKLYVDTHGGGGGNMNYTGTTPATNYIYKASASNGQDAIKSSITDDGTNCVVSATNGITANKIIKSGGTAIQYLMGDGTTLTQSANSGNSNFYLYKSKNGITTPPPLAGDVGYNNAVQSLATLVYISHLTRDNIDIEVFYNQVGELNDLYIQDQNNSLNFIKYNIIGPLIPTPNSYVEIPVVMSSYGGTGNTSFGSNHNVLLAFFSNLTEVDQRITNLETKTQNQSAILQTTSMVGQVHILGAISPFDQTLILNANSTLVNSISSYSYNLAQSCQLQIDALATEIIGPVTCNNGLITTALQCTGQANVGISENPNDILNNGSSLTKNNFNTSQSVGCIGFKDNWATATGNNAVGKNGMNYLSGVDKLIVCCSSSIPQYFNDTTGALININGGLTTGGQFLYIPSLNIAYSRNGTQYSTSSDGINWTVPANILGDISSIGNIIYSPSLNLFVAPSGSLGFFIQTSSDGITWTLRFALRNVYTLIYTGTKFITFGVNGCMYSYDGINWTNDTVQTANIRAAIYCESLGCILAQTQTANRNLIRSYDDGLTWTTLANVFPAQLSTSGGNNKFVWDNVSGKAYCIIDDNSGVTNNSYLFEFDATGNPALGGSIQMMGNTSVLQNANGGLYYYNYNPSLKRFYFTRGAVPHSLFYSTTSLNQAVSGNQYILGSLNCSGGYNPYGLANIDIMLRDTPFIGIQFSNGSAYTATLNSPLLNSPWTAFGSTSSTGSVFSLTNNYTRQLCCADWSFPTPANGQLCGFGSSATTGVRVSTGFNFGISAVLGYADTGYSPGIQNFFGLYNLSTAPALSSTVPVTSLLSCILFGSSTTDANICIYTADAITMVKQVDLGASFPSNRPLGAVSTDWFKLTLYWDTSKFYYKAHNTTTNVIVSGSFSSAAIPATSIQLYPQCLRAMGAAQTSNSCKIKVQRFGVYY